MNTFEQPLSAGVPVTFPGGEQFHLLIAEYPVDITFYASMNKPMETWEGMKGGFRITFKEGFVQVKITSETAQNVKIGVTSGQGVYDRSQGDVSVSSAVITIDESEFYHSSKQHAFWGGYDEPATAGEYSMLQLVNPSASGKNVIVQSIRGFVDVTTGYATIKVIHRSTYLLYPVNDVENKYPGGAANSAKMKHETNETTAGGTGWIKGDIVTPENKKFDLLHGDRIFLEPNQGIVLTNGIVNLGIIGIFEWLEVDQ